MKSGIRIIHLYFLNTFFVASTVFFHKCVNDCRLMVHEMSGTLTSGTARLRAGA
jgi:hypothetical protein